MVASVTAADRKTVEGDQSRPGASRMVPFVIALFFAWGFATVLIDTLIPKLKGLFDLNYAQAMLTQFAFFVGYLVFSIPAGMLLARVGYIRGIVSGLVIMGIGCLLFSPAAALGTYYGFLIALFIMAAGITTLQVAANPLIAALGDPSRASSRLTLAQAFNSLGTTIGPLVGTALILGGGVATPDLKTMAPEALSAFRRTEAHSVQLPFIGIAVVLAVLAIIFWFLRNSPAAPASAPANETNSSSFRMLARPRVALGALSIFAYVGAEVSIGSLLVNYLMQPTTLAATAVTAGHLVALYWGSAMVGRFIGSAALRRVPGGAALLVCAIVAALLAAVSLGTTGTVAAVAVIAIGLFNSIMFPTIFTLAIEGLGEETPQGSGLVCLAIVGGAIIPPITGVVADHSSLALSLVVPIVCYIWIAVYGILTWKRIVDRKPVART
ncbi:MFS transporter, FHS family, L-fucose permease [Faunimonas pinastri]|uniref:MFS transporter, FHS family, L-fucose permease n=1 Tax=Faunimonas pinastri TaxID=1855383 RepID=A0A1H9M3V3_9HYPH|nr:sugar MFS transporter [Faunimonas pinastri]SER18199.1 MFS transporter, FHS family, L-fucose permease [Faunimonas pinastri]